METEKQTKTVGPVLHTTNANGDHISVFDCAQCKELIEYNSGPLGGAAGYARDRDDDSKLYCYHCCGILDRERMQATGKVILYLSSKNLIEHGPEYTITNWPGSLTFPCLRTRKTRHNWGNVQRTDAWFIGPDQYVWHGINLGDNDILRCMRTKTPWIEVYPGSWGYGKPERKRKETTKETTKKTD